MPGTRKLIAYALASLLCLTVGTIAQNQALKARYKQALDAAQAKEYERAYQMAFKIVREDEFYYEAHVLRIALAVILKKTSPEDPANLIRVARDYAPVGANIERDVQNMVNLLSGVPSAKPRETVTVSPYVRRKVALVVGIGSFKDSRINPLRFTSNDARTFDETLRRECRFDEVKLLLDAEATKRNILTEVDRIAKAAKPDDLVVIYVASHGSPEGLDTAGVSYIVTYDSEVDNLYATSYKMEDLLDDIERRIPAQRVVAFLDTCFSGATFKEKPPGWTTSSRGLKVESSGLALGSIESRMRKSERGVKVSPAPPAGGRRHQAVGRIVIASCRQNEKAWESESIKHGYFTYYLIKALSQQKEVSVQTLYDYLSAEVPKAVKQDQNAEQRPAMVSSVDGPVSIFIKE